ncbi:MAG: serine/threonine protein phosphatase [Campylobacteraceae bacterium]|nr:serine/threonine protein phosphatase [Campylobacteraceae bacterium]
MLRVEHFDETKFDKIYVFGDLHGSYDLFNKMLKKIKLTKNDLVIILGDSCDRGKKIAELFYKYKELIDDGYNLKHIMGNHEHMMYHGGFNGNFIEKLLWFKSGGKKTDFSFANYPKPKKSWQGMDKDEELIWLKEWLENMPHILTSQSYIFVHAGYDGRVDLESQDEEFVVWSREAFWFYNNTGKEIYYGHTPNLDAKIQRKANGVYSMDTGSVCTGKLRILEVKSKKEFFV